VITVQEVSGGTSENGEGDRAIPPAASDSEAQPQTQKVLHWAAAEGDEKAVELTRLLLGILEDVNISDFVNERDDNGRTPLWGAIMKGRTAMAELLLDNGAVFDTDGLGGNLTLIKAVENGHDGIVVRLLGLENPIMLNGVDDDGESALHRAVLRGDVKVAELLLDKGANLDAPDAKGWTALHKACVSFLPNWREMVEMLLRRGARVDVGDDEGRTALHRAALALHGPEGQPKSLEFLLMWREMGDDSVDAVDEEGRTPLHVAAASGCVFSVQLLIQAGANFDATDNTSRTPLHITVDEAPPEAVFRIVDMLLAEGADVNRKDANGLTALQKAADKSLERVMEQLLRAKPLVMEKEDANRSSTLHVSAKRGLRDCVRLLVELGASITAKNEKGQTPLHEALQRASRLTPANRRYNNWIGLLMGHPEPDSRVLAMQDEDGNTPLHIAVLNKPDLVELLLKAFPKAASVRNKEGLLPFECLGPPPAAGGPSDSHARTQVVRSSLPEPERAERSQPSRLRALKSPDVDDCGRVQKRRLVRENESKGDGSRRLAGKSNSPSGLSAVRSSIDDTHGQVIDEDESKTVRDLLRYHYVRNIPREDGRFTMQNPFHTKGQGEYLQVYPPSPYPVKSHRGQRLTFYFLPHRAPHRP
jgi:ankyrin repeat protein